MATNEIVVFAVGERTVGVYASTVREVLRAVALTPLPGAPVGVDGVIDLRGTLVPVIDLSARLGVAARALHAADQLLICDVTFGVIAVRADRVIELRAARADPLPAGADSEPLTRSLVRTEDGVIVICELSAFLAASDVTALARAVAGLQVVIG